MKTLISALLMFGICSCAHADDGIAIMGDSVSMGYTKYVKQVMPCVHHTPGNARDSAHTLSKLDEWYAGKDYRIIYFNVGLWDIAHRSPTPTNPWRLDPTDTSPITTPLADYVANLAAIVARLRELEPNAVLVFATTTDVPEGSTGRKEEDVDTYNRAAVSLMRSLGVRVDSLHAFLLPYAYEHMDQGGNMVHYNEAGRQIAAGHVVDVLQYLGGCP